MVEKRLAGSLILLFFLFAALKIISPDPFPLEKGSKKQGAAILASQIEAATNEQERVRLLRELTYLAGPEEAIQFLNNANLESTGGKHLLAHKIGEVAYELYQEKALLYCRNDVYNGCTHGLVLVAVEDIGFEGLKRMADQCKSWSPFKYKLCLHGLGHAFTALADYDIYQAAESCDLLVEPGSSEAYHCYVGLFMENVHGFHDDKSPILHPYLSREDLLYPCNLVPERYKSACYLNQAGWWFVAIFDMDLEKTARYCKNVPEEYQLECVDNIARIILSLVDKNVSLIEEKCSLLPDKWLDNCLESAAFNLFENNDEELAFQLCRKIEGLAVKQSCYKGILARMEAMQLAKEKTEDFCQKFEEDYQSLCRE